MSVRTTQKAVDLMLRLIHKQTGLGPILVDDIDDGLPNKTSHRLGSTADPKATVRDGYSDKPKQPCYIPRVKQTDTSIAGYIDLRETSRVTLSSAKGKILKLKDAGLIDVVSFVAGDLAAPDIATALIDTPGVGDVTIAGTGFLSLAPNTSKVLVTGVGGPLSLTQTFILANAGTFTDTSIVLPAAIIAGVAAVTTSMQVVADDQNSSVEPLA
jgi:hypothetical protein